LVILILMSGLFTPVSSMPDWAQDITIFNPLKYFIEIMRMVYLKGSSIGDLTKQLYALLGFVVVLNGWAVLSYHKNS
jgi:ABC-2 type transport system permease protein